jgi:chemotaxis protein CheD
MADNIETVGIAQYKVAFSPRILSVIGLGSCVGVCLYDPIAKIGGLSHIMLPDSSISKSKEFKPGKFADTAIAVTLDEMIELGALKSRISAKIVGGATMFRNNGVTDPIFEIGIRNVEAAKKTLKNEGIKIVAEDIGGDYGRSIDFFTKNGKVLVRSKIGVKEI